MVVMNEERGHLDTLDFCQTLGITKEMFIKRMNDIKDPAKNPGYSRFTQQLFMTQIDDKNFSVFQEKMFRFLASTSRNAPSCSICTLMAPIS